MPERMIELMGYFVRQAASLLFVASLALSVPVSAQTSPCSTAHLALSLDKRVGSSSFFGNLFGSDESIKSQLKAMFGEAKESLASTASEGSCPEGCTPSGTPQLLFTATPQSFDAEHPEVERCTKLLEATTSTPIVYRDRRFGSFKHLSEAFLDIAQGSGDDGEDLYKRCDGDCSPRYSLYITVGRDSPTPEAPLFQSDILVACGPPRDKSENLYDLGTQLIWKCESK